MSLTKEVVTQENSRTTADRMELHLWKEGTFLRCYDWSAWLACRYLHEFKVSKRVFKGIDEAVAYIGFPETSLTKWLPEGAEQRVEGEKHLLILRAPCALELQVHPFPKVKFVPCPIFSTLFRRICNLAESNISIYNAEKQLR